MVLVIEKTEKEVIKACEMFLKEGLIKKYDKPVKFIHHRSRKDGSPVYQYRAEVTES